MKLPLFFSLKFIIKNPVNSSLLSRLPLVLFNCQFLGVSYFVLSGFYCVILYFYTLDILYINMYISLYGMFQYVDCSLRNLVCNPHHCGLQYSIWNTFYCIYTKSIITFLLNPFFHFLLVNSLFQSSFGQRFIPFVGEIQQQYRFKAVTESLNCFPCFKMITKQPVFQNVAKFLAAK